ncbi:unnamed protein product [Symbiodinium sp. CCMP2592]|nr:unnamed protein product [Symbiodinium sp. CCMP2592]
MAAEHVYQPVGDPPRGYPTGGTDVFQPGGEPTRIYHSRGGLAERCDCTDALRNLGPAMGILASAAALTIIVPALLSLARPVTLVHEAHTTTVRATTTTSVTTLPTTTFSRAVLHNSTTTTSSQHSLDVLKICCFSFHQILNPAQTEKLHGAKADTATLLVCAASLEPWAEASHRQMPQALQVPPRPARRRRWSCRGSVSSCRVIQMRSSSPSKFSGCEWTWLRLRKTESHHKLLLTKSRQ